MTDIGAEEIAQIPTLAALPAKERSSILKLLARRAVDANKVIVREGKLETSMAFIARGRVKVRCENQGKEVIVALLNAGDYFGEISMLTKRPRTADVVALTKTEIFELTREDFIEHGRRFQGLSIALLVALAGRLDNASQRILDLAIYDLPSRMLRILGGMASVRNIQGEAKLVLTPRPTHQDLVSLIGAPQKQVSECLRELEKRQLVTLEAERIVIHQVPRV